MIFGGFNSSHNDKVLIFNTLDKTIQTWNFKLRRRWSFIQRNSTWVEDNQHIFAIGFPFMDVHRYNFSEQIWKYLDAKKWFNFL